MTSPDRQFDYDARTERLLQRLQRPGGVIDPRWPQERVTRAAGWIGRRFSLLDRWNARYNSPAFEAVWAIDEQRSSTASPGSLLPPVPGGSMSMEVEAKPDSEPHRFRVKRQMAPPQPSALSPNTEQNDAAGNSSSPGGIESPSQAATGKTVQRKKDTARVQDAQTSTAVFTFSPTRTSEIYPEHEQWFAAMPLQPSSIAASGEFSEAGAEEAVIDDSSQPSWPSSPVSIQRKTNPAADRNTWPDSTATSSLLVYPARQAARKTESAPELSGSQSSNEMAPHAPEALPGRIAGPLMQETGNHSHKTQNPVTIQRKLDPSSRVRETPRQGPSPAVGPMIWRRAGTAQMSAPAGRPLFSGGPAAIQRFADSPGSASSSSSISNSNTPAATGRTELGINLAQMAENVGRLLARQLVIERERRGRAL